MYLVGTLIRRLYSRVATVAGSITTFAWWCLWRFFASTATWCAVGSTLFPWDMVLYRCVACGRSYFFLCIDHSGIASLVPLMFWCIFPCCCWWWSCLSWTSKFMIPVLRLFLWIQPWRWGLMIFHTWKFRALLYQPGWGGVGITSLFGIIVSASKILANYLIALSWESYTWKCDFGLGVCKAFAISAAERMAISIEL